MYLVFDGTKSGVDALVATFDDQEKARAQAITVPSDVSQVYNTETGVIWEYRRRGIFMDAAGNRELKGVRRF